MATKKRGAAQPMRTNRTELKKLFKEALAEHDEAKDEFDEVVDAMPEDIQDIVAEALEVVAEKRKARKDTGEALDDVTVDEVMEEVEAILAESKGVPDGREEPTKSDDAQDEEKDGDPDDEEKDDDPDSDEKRRRKAALARRERKGTNAPAVQRKYSDNFRADTGGAYRPARKRDKDYAYGMLGRSVKCLDIHGRNDPDRAAHAARKHYGDADMEREFKALAATIPTAGGYLIPEVYLSEVIELLYAKTVIFALGARKVPMPNGNLNIPKMTTGARAWWGGEQRKIAKTQPTFGNIRLSAKRLEAIVPQTREMIMSTDYSADVIFGQDLARRMELGLDYGAIFGKGTEFEPRGVVNTEGIEIIDASRITDAALVKGGGITASFPVYVRSVVMQKNVDDMAMGWAFNSMMEGYLMNLMTTTGAFIYRDEMIGGKLLGFPYRISNQIPMQAGDKTGMLFGNWADLMVGEQMGLETFTTLEGSWVDEDGVQHNAFEENLVGTRALMYVDVAARHAESFAYVKNAVITGPTA